MAFRDDDAKLGGRARGIRGPVRRTPALPSPLPLVPPESFTEEPRVPIQPGPFTPIDPDFGPHIDPPDSPVFNPTPPPPGGFGPPVVAPPGGFDTIDAGNRFPGAPPGTPPPAKTLPGVNPPSGPAPGSLIPGTGPGFPGKPAQFVPGGAPDQTLGGFRATPTNVAPAPATVNTLPFGTSGGTSTSVLPPTLGGGPDVVTPPPAPSVGPGVPPDTSGLDTGTGFENLTELGAFFGAPQQPPPELMGPAAQVGQDPFSQLITGGISDVIGAGGGPTTEFGGQTQDAISRLLDRGGAFDENILGRRLESSIEGLNTLESSRINNLEARLADRGLIGSGPQKGGLEGIARDIAGIGATEFRNIIAAEQEQANQRFNTGASLAAGLTAQQPQNLLDATGQGTGRQDILSRIALDTLRNQQDFAETVGRFGLDRDLARNQIEDQRLGQIAGLINSLFNVPQIARGGFI